MEDIDAKYAAACAEPSDINEHLPTLRRLAGQCSSVAEMGVRGIVSTWALLKGLVEAPAGETAASGGGAGSGAPPKSLLCVDIEPIPGIAAVAALAAEAGVQLRFQQGDSAQVQLPQAGVDLLFIDTWHVYGHLKRELAAHHARVHKFIALHDTTVDAELGETIRMGMDSQAQVRESGYPLEEILRGLWPAVQEFLEAQAGEWELAERWENNNGLTVLRRRGVA